MTNTPITTTPAMSPEALAGWAMWLLSKGDARGVAALSYFLANHPTPAERQAGATTQQMMAAPIGAIFVWCNGRLDYPRALAMHLQREDLEIVAPYWLTRHTARTARPRSMVIDHAARLTGEQMQAKHVIQRRINLQGLLGAL
ncbi:MAG: hypothetical protein AB7P37_03475 [Ramlibacter sp.]